MDIKWHYGIMDNVFASVVSRNPVIAPMRNANTWEEISPSYVKKAVRTSITVIMIRVHIVTLFL